MFRSTLLVAAAALAVGCGAPLTANDTTTTDHRVAALSRRGEWDEARILLDREIAGARARGDQRSEARLLLQRGRTLTEKHRHQGGDRAPALADLDAACKLADAIADRALIGDCTDARGMHRFVQWFSSRDPADLAGAETLFLEALTLRAPAGDTAAHAESEFHAGLIDQMRGAHDAAHTHFERSRAIAERARDDEQLSYATRHLGYLAQLRRDWQVAEDYYAHSLVLRERIGRSVVVAAAQVTLAELRYARTASAEPALELLTRARDLAANTGSPPYVSISSAAMARIHRDHARYDEAIQLLTAGIAAVEPTGSNETIPDNYEQIALIQLLAERPADAVATAERGVARRSTPSLVSVLALARARARAGATLPDDAGGNPAITARLALAAGKPADALAAALTGDEPDTLLLAARANGPEAFPRAIAAAAALSPAQGQRFERMLGAR